MRGSMATGVLAAIAASLALAAPAQALTFGAPLRLTEIGPPGNLTRGTNNPSIAHAPLSGGRYLLAYRGDGGATENEFEIWFRLFDAAGAPLTADTRLSFAGTEGSTEASADRAAVAFNPVSNEFMVAWEEIDLEPVENQFEVWFTRVSADGVPVDLNGAAPGYASRISDTEPAVLDVSGRPAIAVNATNGEALVAFSDFRSGGDGDADIAVQRLSAAGAQIPGAADSVISGVPAAGPAASPAVAYNAVRDQYGVAWDQSTGGGYFQGLTGTGLQVPPNDVSYFAPVTHGGPAIASAGSAGWQIAAQTEEADAPQVSVLRMSGTGVPTAPVLALTGSTDDAALAADTFGGFLVTATGLGPQAREIGADGTPRDGQASVGLGFALPSPNPAVAFDPGAQRWLVVGSGFSAGVESEVYGAFSGAPPPASPSPQPAAPASPAAPTPPKLKAVAFSSVTTLPSPKACASRRAFRIRIREPAGVNVTEVRVYVNGRRVRLVKGVRRTATVNLRGLPKGRFSVKIVVRTADGRKVTGTRKYRTCAPKRRSGSVRPRV